MTTLTPNTYAQCPTALIVASTTNRKHFAPEPLQALSDNIKARGIDQPIIVRALPGARLAETYDAPKGMDLGSAIAEKMAYNAQRADHKPEARAGVGGKTY